MWRGHPGYAVARGFGGGASMFLRQLDPGGQNELNIKKRTKLD